MDEPTTATNGILQHMDVLDLVLAKAGFAAFLLTLACLGLIKLYLMERKERQKAWDSHITLSQETNKILSDLKIVLEVIKSKLH